MYDELVKALRVCVDEDKDCLDCPYYSKCMGNDSEKHKAMVDAADAIEELIAERDKYKRHSESISAKPKPVTNADRIRAMSDEELAHFMMRTTDCPCVARANGCCRSNISCQKAWLEWLKEATE